ncbi:MAG TPA: hypothetical protein EYH40_02130 [Desulfurococcales archaeon]|nr:hypothetical protein [Desulfurococcales archaeon]
MKKESRIAILSHTKLKKYIIVLLTVFRYNLIDGICFNIIPNLNVLPEFIRKCKYIGEVRLIVYLAEDSSKHIYTHIGGLRNILPHYIVVTSNGEILEVGNVKPSVIRELYTKMNIYEKINIHKNILQEAICILEGGVYGE